jgi:hypothetical protein
MIADYLVIVEGISVFDILGSKQEPASHELTPLAHFSSHDKNITYPESRIDS